MSGDHFSVEFGNINCGRPFGKFSRFDKERKLIDRIVKRFNVCWQDLKGKVLMKN